MTSEDKELLLKDLCARLPYGIKAQVYNHWRDEVQDETITIENLYQLIETFSIEDIKPYLLPLSSMNLDQRIEYSKTLVIFDESHCSQTSETYDWLNKNNFDYRDLIPKGIANDATGLNIY